MLSLHAKTRPLRPSPLAHCSYNSQQSSPPPSASPSLGWSSSSMASSSSPTRSHHDTHSYETGTLHGGSSPFFTPPWQKEASTPRTTKRAQQYKSTTSSRSHVSTSSYSTTTGQRIALASSIHPAVQAAGEKCEKQSCQREEERLCRRLCIV